jgi:hypothetical protein
MERTLHDNAATSRATWKGRQRKPAAALAPMAGQILIASLRQRRDPAPYRVEVAADVEFLTKRFERPTNLGVLIDTQPVRVTLTARVAAGIPTAGTHADRLGRPAETQVAIRAGDGTRLSHLIPIPRKRGISSLLFGTPVGEGFGDETLKVNTQFGVERNVANEWIRLRVF